jgi:ATP-binding cassette subfamily F protein uup
VTSQAKKLSSNDIIELENLPALIEALETEQTNINNNLANADIYRENPEQVKILQGRLSEVEIEIEEKLDRWSTLEALSN